jgi:hypothetical protein
MGGSIDISGAAGSWIGATQALRKREQEDADGDWGTGISLGVGIFFTDLLLGET